MRLYRSIGERELMKLLREIVVFGNYDCQYETQTTANCNNVVCFFKEPFKWTDKKHEFFITVDVNEMDCEKGIGTYYVPKATKKSMKWTGRRGNEVLELKEMYVHTYCISDVVEIQGLNKFSNTYFNSEIKPVLDKYGIKAER